MVKQQDANKKVSQNKNNNGKAGRFKQDVRFIIKDFIIEKVSALQGNILCHIFKQFNIVLLENEAKFVCIITFQRIKMILINV